MSCDVDCALTSVQTGRRTAPGKRRRRTSGSDTPETRSSLLALHRARFVKWTPTPVVAMKASADGTVLALARASGDLEIWDTEYWTLVQVPVLNVACFRQTFFQNGILCFRDKLDGS